MDSKIDSSAGVKNTNFGLLRCGFTFKRFLLAKIPDDLGGLPERVVEGPIQLGRLIDAHCFGDSRPFLRWVLGKNGRHTRGI